MEQGTWPAPTDPTGGRGGPCAHGAPIIRWKPLSSVFDQTEDDIVEQAELAVVQRVVAE